jgi:ribonuclease VapC
VIVDASALIAIVLREPGHHTVVAKLAAVGEAGIGAPTLVETGIVLSVRLGRDARPLLARLLQEAGLTVVPFGEPHWRAAIDAYGRFGKGRHPAALNFGDCLTYAVARLAKQPLLCVGNDFSRTDLPLA